jgi:hypothetical protein
MHERALVALFSLFWDWAMDPERCLGQRQQKKIERAALGDSSKCQREKLEVTTWDTKHLDSGAIAEETDVCSIEVTTLDSKHLDSGATTEETDVCSIGATTLDSKHLDSGATTEETDVCSSEVATLDTKHNKPNTGMLEAQSDNSCPALRAPTGNGSM